jgi:adenylylsulfate kinase-like enzyme
MYNLHNLGWHSFQQLCLAIAREILGQTVESFLDSADAGRDGAFAGVWKPLQGEALSGRFVIQCKFTSKRDKNLSLPDVKDEVAKARKLVEDDRCDCYILMTNAGLSGSISEDVEGLFKDAGVKQVRSFGSTWICQQIQESKRLRMLVPRIYGLGDLSQILDERAYSQAKALISSLREELSKVVLTTAYRRAAEALNHHGFVLLIGEPAAGKTTIASMLSMGALDQWGVSTLKLDAVLGSGDTSPHLAHTGCACGVPPRIETAAGRRLFAALLADLDKI